MLSYVNYRSGYRLLKIFVVKVIFMSIKQL